jgi:hypothetical protein
VVAFAVEYPPTGRFQPATNCASAGYLFPRVGCAASGYAFRKRLYSALDDLYAISMHGSSIATSSRHI